jgi:hypothetical protein
VQWLDGIIDRIDKVTKNLPVIVIAGLAWYCIKLQEESRLKDVKVDELYKIMYNDGKADKELWRQVATQLSGKIVHDTIYIPLANTEPRGALQR